MIGGFKRVLHAVLIAPAVAGMLRAADVAVASGLAVAPVESTNAVDFYREIVPMLQGNCLPCHNKTSTKADLLLETPADMLRGGENGPAIVPGNAAGSLLFRLAAHREKPRMPPKDNKVNAVNLSPRELGLLSRWIDEGAVATGRPEEIIAWKALAPGRGPILSAAVSSDGQYAAAGRGNQIAMYHLPTGTPLGALVDPSLSAGPDASSGAAHRDWVNALAFSPDGRLLASGGFREVKLWSRAAMALVPLGSNAPAIAESTPPWRSRDTNRVATPGTNGVVELSDGAGTRIAELRQGPEVLLSVARARAAVERNRAVRDREKSQLEAAVKEVQAQQDRLKRALESVAAATKTLGEKDLIAARARQDHLLATVRREVAERAAAGDTNAPGLKAADERLAATRTALDKAEGEQRPAALKASTADNELHLSREGLARAEGVRARAEWRLREAGEVLVGSEAVLKASETERDGKPAAVVAAAFSPDGRWLATGDAGGGLVFWAANRGTPVASLRAPAAITRLGFEEPDRCWVATAQGDYSVDLNPAWTWVATLTGTNDTRLADRVNAVAFSPDGRWLVSGGGEPSRSGEVWFWDVGTRGQVFGIPQLHSDAVLSAAFSPDGRWLATGGADRFARLVDVASGRQVRALEGHTGHVLGVGWRADGLALATAGADLIVKFWDPATGERRKQASGFGHEVTSVSHLAGTDQWVAASGDAGLRVVNENGDRVRGLSGSDDFTQALAVTPDGRWVIAGGQDGVLRLWESATEQPAGTFAPEPEGRQGASGAGVGAGPGAAVVGR